MNDARLWCKVITCLSPPSDESRQPFRIIDQLNALDNIDPSGSLRNFFVNQFLTCTPWFVELFVQTIRTLIESFAEQPTLFMDELLC